MRNGAGALVGVGVVCFAFAGCGGADTSPHANIPPERVGEKSQPLQQTIEAPAFGGAVTTLAGNGQPGSTDAANPLQGKFNDPAGIAVAASGPNAGTIYIADWGNNSIRRIKPDGTLDTFLQGKPNLVVNPRAEQPVNGSVVPGWTSSTFRARGDSYAYDGSYYLWGGPFTSATATQEIPFTPSGTQRIHFSAVVRASDRAAIKVEYLNASSAVLATFDTGWITSTPWTNVVNERFMSINTRKVRITLSTSLTQGTEANGYFDALQFRALPQSGDGDRGLIGPNAVAVAANGDVIIGGEGVTIASADGATLTPLAGTGGYVPPKRVSNISIVPEDGFIYFADPTDTRLHVRSANGFGYYANIAGGVNDEPIAIAVQAKNSTVHRVWAAYRHEAKLYLSECPKLENQNAATATCTGVTTYGASSAGMADDVDGTVGGERLGYNANALLFGGSGDLLIAEEANHAIRRAASAFTRTLAGNGARGFANGSSLSSQFWSPSGMALQGSNVLVADRMNNVIRKIACGASNVCAAAAGSTCDLLPVDDHIECTTDTCEVIAIRHAPKATGASCPDGNLCNGNETCTAVGVCQPGTPLALDDSKACSADSCDPASGVAHAPLPAGTPCSSADPCRALSSCNGTSLDCPQGSLLPTDDFNDCTVDACGATGITHTPKATNTACKVNTLSASNDGTCDAGGGCSPTSITQGTIDRTVPTPTSALFDDFLASNGGGQTGTTACINDAAHPACAFVPTHMALIRGTVADTSGAGLPSVGISVVGHPEFGTTQTLANGEYFMVVNGGAPLTVRATGTGFLRSDRLVNPAWGGTDLSQDIVLVPLDGKTTAVAMAVGGLASSVLASGTATPANFNGDISKTRNAAVYFPPSVKAYYNNGTQITSGVKFRVTEYTAGGQGRARMPADVAANTMYTYASEFTLEDAAGNVYDNVTFPASGPPVFAYVDNFLELNHCANNASVPVDCRGDIVPVGYYDRQSATWQPMKSGQVIKIESVSGGVATVSGVDPAQVTLDERTKLGAYPAGTRLWRLPIAHFSPLDFNLGLGAPACETQGTATVCPGPVAALATGGDDGPACGSCSKTGSIIDVERQVLRETFPVVGTPFSLNYSSENTLGYAWNKTLSVNLESFPKHSKFQQFVIDFKVAGKRVAQGGIGPTGGVFPNWTWPKSYQASWDGRDQDGRVVQGAVVATLDVGAKYKAERSQVSTFGSTTGAPMALPSELTGTREDASITVWTRRTKQLQVWDASALGFGGWTMDVHHAFDPNGSVIYLGDGTHRKVDGVSGGIMSLVAGRVGPPGSSPDGTDAATAALGHVQSLAVNRDGDVFAAMPSEGVVRKINFVNGVYSTVRDYAGKSNAAVVNATAPDLQPVPAVGGYFLDPIAIALHDDGRLVIADRGTRRVYEVSADGTTLRTIAGSGAACTNDGQWVAFVDGVSARSVDLCTLTAAATGPDGSVYFINAKWSGGSSYVARIDQAGALWRVAGAFGVSTYPNYYRDLPPGLRGPDVGLSQTGLAVDRNNTIWLSTDIDVVAVPPGGPVRVYPMPQRSEAVHGELVDFALFPDIGFLRPSADYTLDRCTTAGACAIVTGTTTWRGGDAVIGEPAVGSQLQGSSQPRPYRAAAIGPDGSIFEAHKPVSDSQGTRIFRVVTTPVPPSPVADCVYKVPAQDAHEYYCFDVDGRHKSTVHGLTNGLIRSFQYDASGLLSKIVEADNRQTVIDRSVANLVKIMSPNGQQTSVTLDSTGRRYATGIAGDGAITVSHDSNNGLLRSLVDANLQPHSFTYDNFGRLQKDTDPAGGFQALARTDPTASKYAVSVTTRLGKTDSYSREMLGDGTEQRIITGFDGLSTTAKLDLAGSTITESPDKTVFSQTPMGDPRGWGMLAPFISKASVSFPAGPYAQGVSTSRALGAPRSFTDTVTLTGTTTRSYQRVYTDATKTFELTTPLGRKVTYTLDAQGRVVGIQRAGEPRIDVAINPVTGLVDQVSQGTGRVVSVAHATSGANKGFLTALDDPHASTDPAPLKTVFGPDGNGRPLTATRKEVATQRDITTNFLWTASGSLKTLTPPGKPAHQLTYDSRGQLTTYVPPTLGGTDEKTTFTLDLDRYLQSIDSPGYDDLSVTTDPIKGRPTSMQVSGQKIDFAYYGPIGDPSCPAGCAPGHLRTITDNRTPGGVITTFKWVNALPKSIDEAGATVSWNYNNDIRVTDETLVASAHTSAVSHGYDLDGLLTSASLSSETISLERESTSGRLSGVTLGTSPKETLTYNSYGELRAQDSTPFRIDYEDVASTPNVLRDASGRVKRRIERIGVGATPQRLDYTYDDQNRLWKVDKSVAGVTVTNEYRYDDDGNRTYWKNSLGEVSNVQYDPQGRLLQYTPPSPPGFVATFDYTPKGDLWHRSSVVGPITYDYDALGALRQVTLQAIPFPNVIEYVVDGLGRRIGKKKNGVMIKQWRYGRGLAPIAELDGTGNVTMRFIYGSRPNVPDFIKTYPNNKSYRVFADQLGSPRMLYDVATGTVAKTMDFDEFGRKLTDSNGALQIPFGFAGGLFDEETGLTRFGARDYDASIGRWVSKDPILFGGGQTNLYVYVANDPVNGWDPLGLKDWSNDEVSELLRAYASRLDRSPLPMLLMANQHRGNETDDGTGGDFDFWGRPLTTDDTFTLCGVGKMSSAQFGNFIAGFAAGTIDSPTAYWLVRAAGSAYGIKAWKDGSAPLGPLGYLGDSADSVDYIDQGLYWGLKEAGHY